MPLPCWTCRQNGYHLSRCPNWRPPYAFDGQTDHLRSTYYLNPVGGSTSNGWTLGEHSQSARPAQTDYVHFGPLAAANANILAPLSASYSLSHAPKTMSSGLNPFATSYTPLPQQSKSAKAIADMTKAWKMENFPRQQQFLTRGQRNIQQAQFRDIPKSDKLVVDVQRLRKQSTQSGTGEHARTRTPGPESEERIGSEDRSTEEEYYDALESSDEWYHDALESWDE